MSLINDLLDLSKVEAGKLDLDVRGGVAQRGDPGERGADAAAGEPRAHHHPHLALGRRPNVVADLRSLRQIMLNLLSNAIKFTRSGGQVIVATALEDSGEVVIRIRDTGIGMTAKRHRHGDEAVPAGRHLAARPHEGTGLGLPLTKALVEANRATFAIDSIPNQGTLVRVTFPTTRVLAG